MALLKCSECGKEISDKATACPGCGCPTPFKQDAQPIHASTNKAPIDNKKPAVSIYDYDSSTTRTNSYGGPPPEIPTGLYWTMAILGFPLGTGMAIGFNIGANSRIKKGDYAKAQKYINSTKIACWIIIIPCAIAVLLLLSMFSLIFR